MLDFLKNLERVLCYTEINKRELDKKLGKTERKMRDGSIKMRELKEILWKS